MAVNFDFPRGDLPPRPDYFAYPEVRISALGMLDGRVHSRVFAETGNGIHVISFRQANKREVKRYEQETQPWVD